MNYLCISIDGWHSGMIGAYGNTWIQTPVLDRLASQSVLFDRFYAETLDLAAIFDTYWRDLPDCRKILVTDDEDVFLHEQASGFDERHRLEPFRGTVPVRTLEETQFFKGLAAVTDIAVDCAKSVEPFFLWAHFSGFRGYWDFPLEYRQKHQDDEDPVPYFETKPPNIPPQEIDPDKLQAVMETYSGGIAVLDDAFAGLIDALEEGELGSETVLILVSVRGFSLGEHCCIGINSDIYSENVQLPLFIRFSDCYGASVRSQTLLQPVDLAELLKRNEIPEEPEELHQTLQIGESAIITPEWFLRNGELYVKPDDRWEINDVADRCRHVIESFDTQHQSSTHQ